MTFENQKLGLTHDHHVESHNSNHSITIFLLIASYFLTHLCIINLLVQTLKKYKSTHSKEKMEICSNLDCKYSTLLIGDGCRLVMGTSTIVLSFPSLKIRMELFMNYFFSYISLFVSREKKHLYMVKPPLTNQTSNLRHDLV